MRAPSVPPMWLRAPLGGGPIGRRQLLPREGWRWSHLPRVWPKPVSAGTGEGTSQPSWEGWDGGQRLPSGLQSQPSGSQLLCWLQRTGAEEGAPEDRGRQRQSAPLTSHLMGPGLQSWAGCQRTQGAACSHCYDSALTWSPRLANTSFPSPQKPQRGPSAPLLT